MSAEQVVTQYIDAFAAKDHEKVQEFFSKEKFSFVGPLEQFNDPSNLVEAQKKLSPIMKEIVVRQIFSKGDEVVVIYNMVTNQEQLGTSRITEWFKVENEKITSVEVFFDASPFAAMFAH